MIEIIIIIIIIFIITACFTIIQNCCYRTSPPELIEIVVNDEIINDEIINDDDDGLPSYTEIIKN